MKWKQTKNMAGPLYSSRKPSAVSAKRSGCSSGGGRAARGRGAPPGAPGARGPGVGGRDRRVVAPPHDRGGGVDPPQPLGELPVLVGRVPQEARRRLAPTQHRLHALGRRGVGEERGGDGRGGVVEQERPGL